MIRTEADIMDMYRRGELTMEEAIQAERELANIDPMDLNYD